MDKKGTEVIQSIMALAYSKEFTGGDVPEQKPSKFPCKRCGGTGWLHWRENGVDYAAECPDCKEARAIARYLRGSGITKEDYDKYTLDTFLTDTNQTVLMRRTAEDFLRNPNALGCGYFGPPGTGKTHICIAICQALHKEHHYWQYRREIQRIKLVMYKDIDAYERMIRKPSEWPYLYIDDLFKNAVTEKGLAQQDAQIMFDIINVRYMRKLPTIISSEYTLEQITEFDEAIGSRLGEMLYPYICTLHAENRRTAKARLKNT